MHSWGRWPDREFDKIDELASFIAHFLVRWGRIPVAQYKEKFGTVRVYCTFDWDSVHSIVFPFHHWIHKWWPWKLDCLMSGLFLRLFNIISRPYKKWVYRLAYKKAIAKYPHLKNEILDCTDWSEELQGL